MAWRMAVTGSAAGIGVCFAFQASTRVTSMSRSSPSELLSGGRVHQGVDPRQRRRVVGLGRTYVHYVLLSGMLRARVLILTVLP